VFFYKHELTKSATNKMVLDKHSVKFSLYKLMRNYLSGFQSVCFSFCASLSCTSRGE